MKVIALILNMMVVCISQAYAQNSITKQSSVYFTHEFRDSFSEKKVEVVGPRQAYIKMKGQGTLVVKIESVTQKTEAEIICSSQQKEVYCMLWSKPYFSYDPQETYKIKLQANIFGRGDSKFLNVELVGGEMIELSGPGGIHIHTGITKFIDLQVTMGELPPEFDLQKGRLSFVVLQPYSSKVDIPQNLRMMVSKERGRVEPTQANFTSTSKIGAGMIITVLPKDGPLFCVKKDCQYSVRLEVSDVKEVSYFTEITTNLKEFKLDKDVIFIEQLRDKDEITLHLIDGGKDKRNNWMFSLIPIEGNPDMAVSFDKKAATFKENHYFTNKDSTEKIFVSKESLLQNGLKGEEVWVTLNSSQSSEFLLEVNSIPDAYRFISPNIPTTGAARPNEQITYIFKIEPDVPELISIFVKLSALSNDPNLYIKNCTQSNYRTCSLSQSELQNKKSDSEKGLFRFSAHPSGDDNIQLKFNCIPKSEEFQDYEVEEKNKQFFTTRQCVFGITVVGGQLGVQNESKYTLELHGSKYHNLLSLNKTTYLNLLPKAKYYYQLNVLDEPTSNEFINFKFLTISGEADIYISKFHPYPDENNSDKHLNIEEATKTGQTQIKIMSFQKNSTTFKGKYFVAIEAKKFFYGNLEVFTSKRDMEEPDALRFSEISIGEQVMGILPGDAQTPHTYSFAVGSPQTETEILVELIPIKGKFDLCVSNNDSKIEKSSDCTWRDTNKDNKIVINNKDKNFKRDEKYGVLVHPRKGSVFEGYDFSYILSITSPESYYTLALGSPARFEKLPASKYFRLEISRYFSNFMLMLDTNDPNATLMVSPLNPDLYSEQPSSSMKLADGRNQSVFYTEKMIKEMCPNDPCPLYIRLIPGKSSPWYSYTLLPFSSDANIQLTDGRIDSIPSPMKRDQVIRYSPQTNESSLVISVYSQDYQYSVEVTVTGTIVKEKESDQQLNERIVSNDPLVNVIRIPESLLSNLTHPQVEIRIVNTKVKGDSTGFIHDDFDLKRRTDIQISTGIAEINDRTIFREPFARKGRFYYYSLKKYSSQNAHVNLKVVYGEADLYVRKGADNLPDLNTFDQRSNTVSSDELVLPFKLLQEDEEDQLETFIIGVYVVENAHYLLQVNFFSNIQYLSIVPGQAIEHTLHPGVALVLAYNQADYGKVTIGASCWSPDCFVNYKVLDEVVSKGMINDLKSKADQVINLDKPGFISRTHISPPGGFKSVQYYFVATALKTTKFTFFLLRDNRDVLKIKSGTVFSDSLELSECQTYMMQYDSETMDEEFSVSVEKGTNIALVASLTNPENGSQIKALMVKKIDGTKYGTTSTYKLIDFLKNGSSVPKLNIFQKYYINVCSTSGKAFFKLQTKSSKVSLIQMVPGSRIYLDLTPNKGQKLRYYFKVEPKELTTLKIILFLGSKAIKENFGSNADENAVLNAFSFSLLPIEDFGSSNQGTHQKSISAQIVKKELKEDRLEISFSPTEGYLILEANENVRTNLKLSYQLIVNDYKVISSDGETYEEIEKGKKYIFQVINYKQNGRFYFLATSCGGSAEVKFYDMKKHAAVGNLSSPEAHLNIGRDYKGKNILDLLTDRPLEQGFSGQSAVGYFIVVENKNIGSDPVIITLKVKNVTPEDTLTAEDFFSRYRTSSEDEVKIYSLEGAKGPQFSMVINPIKPAMGFAEKYTNYERAEIIYTVAVGRNMSLDAMFDYKCPLRAERLESEGLVVRREIQQLDMKPSSDLGVFSQGGKVVVWPNSSFEIKNMKYPVDQRPPFFGQLQIMVKLYGKYDDSSDDDTTINIRYRFEIGEGFIKEHMQEISIVGVIMICLILCVCAYVFYAAKKIDGNNSQNRSGGGYRISQVNTLDLDDTSGNKTEADETNNRIESIELQQKEPEDYNNEVI